MLSAAPHESASGDALDEGAGKRLRRIPPFEWIRLADSRWTGACLGGDTVVSWAGGIDNPNSFLSSSHTAAFVFKADKSLDFRLAEQ